MTESIDRPEGAVPTPADNPEPVEVDAEGAATGTMIGEPLPVGAYEDGAPEPEPEHIPGLPKPADDLDRQMAREHQRLIEERNTIRGTIMRPDQATIPDARRGTMHDYDGRGVREGLLRTVRIAAEREEKAVNEWAQGVRAREEARAEYASALAEREAAETAIVVLGLDVEGDHAMVEPTTTPEVIDDSAIV